MRTGNEDLVKMRRLAELDRAEKSMLLLWKTAVAQFSHFGYAIQALGTPRKRPRETALDCENLTVIDALQNLQKQVHSVDEGVQSIDFTRAKEELTKVHANYPSHGLVTGVYPVRFGM